jgi:glycosyltransferase involved in cell wall biosynthesis
VGGYFKAMNWLIVEDALQDRKGHWYEYINTFARELRALGDNMTVLCDHRAEPFILEKFHALPVLPQSIWGRMSDNAMALKRFIRIPLHAFATLWVMRKFLARYLASSEFKPDFIFVPTVLVHHLLGWWMLLNTASVPNGTRLLLFFPNLPILLGDNDDCQWHRGASVTLKKILFTSLRKYVESGKLILGVETRAMQNALQKLIGIPVLYFPHPVSYVPKDVEIICDYGLKGGERGRVTPEVADQNSELGDGDSKQDLGHKYKSANLTKPILFGCYGPARWEKGTDILQKAIRQVLEQNPDIRAKFVFQWLNDFRDNNGKKKTLDPWLKNHPNVEVIDRYFKDGEYERWLAETDVMLLPYRSPYRLRISRVAIEAMINGMPAVVSGNTTLWSDFQQFGAAYPFHDESPSSLAAAICRMMEDFQMMSLQARERMAHSRRAFSVEKFRATLTKNHSYKEISVPFISSRSVRKSLYQRGVEGLVFPPLLVTGFPRSGKTTLSRIMLQTHNFRLIHEPFSNFRGQAHRSAIIRNLKNMFTHITPNNAWQFQRDVVALLNYFTYSYRSAIDGEITLKKIIKYLTAITLKLGNRSRLPLIDDPFLALSAPWLIKTLGWNVIVMIRGPLDSVTERTLQGFGFDFFNLINQTELMEGPLRAYASEIREIANHQDTMSTLIKNAYLWKYIHVCILRYIEMFPEILFLRFEDMKDEGFQFFANWVNTHYRVDFSNRFNLFQNFDTNTEYFLSESEKSDIKKITNSVVMQLSSAF